MFQMFIKGDKLSIAKIFSLVRDGIQLLLVTVEVHLLRGLPAEVTP